MIFVIKEAERSIGYNIAIDSSTGQAYRLLEGQPVMFAADGKLKPYDGTPGALPMGLAAESNVMYPIQGDPFTVGVGYDYNRFNRGGLVSFFFNGGMFELTSDPRGTVFVDTDTYVINKPVYVNSNGKITSDSNNGNNPMIGVVVNYVTQSGKVVSLTIKLTI
jgi:hypothetical protein